LRNRAVADFDYIGMLGLSIGDFKLSIDPLDEGTVKPDDKSAKFYRNNTLSCKCVSSSDGSSTARITCELKAKPSTRTYPGALSEDLPRKITQIEHERNHFEVYKKKWIPSFYELFSYYAYLECCNCEERRSELETLWKELDHNLYVWEDSTEYPTKFKKGTYVHRQPQYDYGMSKGSVASAVNPVLEKMKTKCDY